MNRQSKRTKQLACAAILAVLPLFAACGGEKVEASKQDDNGGINIAACLTALIFSAGRNSSWCESSSGSGNTGGSGGSGSTGGSGESTPPPSSGSIRILGQVEIEPNDDRINANPVNFSSSTDGKVGFTVAATISDVDDHVDYFTFARPRSRDLRFQLCPQGQMICENAVQVDSLTAFYDILDQDGKVLASTQAAEFNVNVMRIEAGIPYFVRVTAGDTMAATVGYRLTVYETN